MSEVPLSMLVLRLGWNRIGMGWKVKYIKILHLINQQEHEIKNGVNTL